jgi:hypothetical protein
VAQDRYEASDADARLIAVLAIGIGGFLIAAPLALSMAYVFPRQEQLSTVRRPPLPRLQVAPADDLAKLHASEDRDLTTYDWVDRPNGLVRIPISFAMELIARRGIPGWAQSAPDPQAPPRAGAGR